MSTDFLRKIFCSFFGRMRYGLVKLHHSLSYQLVYRLRLKTVKQTTQSLLLTQLIFDLSYNINVSNQEMKSSTNGDNKVAQPTVDFRKIPYDKGSEWTTEWVEDFAKYVRMLPEGLFKKQMVSVLDKGANYTPEFRTLDAVMKEYNITDPEHGKVLENAISKAVSQETINLPSIRSQSHAIIVHLLERCAKAVASADPIFRENDELANPDPVATVLALKRILITEREGTGSVRKLASKTAAIIDLLAIQKNSTSNENESLTDFRD